MPRRCHCARLLAMLERDALRLAGLAAQAVFLRVMARAHELGSDGFLPLGSTSGSGIGNLTELSRVLTCDETELQTQLETLVARGVLVVEPGGIACPEIRDGARKAAVSRQNGAGGGRPRRGETAAEARARRQGHFMLPMAGGKPTGTHEGTQDETPSRARRSDDDKSINHHPSDAREGTELSRLVDEVAEVAGIDTSRVAVTYGPVRAWKAMGLSRERILAVVGQVAGRSRGPIGSLAYFNHAMEAEAQRPAPAVVERSPEELAARVRAADECAAWINRGMIGPRPASAAILLAGVAA